MRIALFEPDIPGNVGTMLRTAACLGLAVDLIEPMGFPFDHRALRRAGLDYLGQVEIRRHPSWEAYLAARGKAPGRLLLLGVGGRVSYTHFAFAEDDTLMVGRESAGVPAGVRQAVDAEVAIPMMPGRRSLNVAVALAMVVGEALRQTGRFPAAVPA